MTFNLSFSSQSKNSIAKKTRKHKEDKTVKVQNTAFYYLGLEPGHQRSLTLLSFAIGIESTLMVSSLAGETSA